MDCLGTHQKNTSFNHGPFLVRLDSLRWCVWLSGLTSSITPRSSRATPGAATTSLMRSNFRRFRRFRFRRFLGGSVDVPPKGSLKGFPRRSFKRFPMFVTPPKTSDVEGVFGEGHVYTLG